MRRLRWPCRHHCCCRPSPTLRTAAQRKTGQSRPRQRAARAPPAIASSARDPRTTDRTERADWTRPPPECCCNHTQPSAQLSINADANAPNGVCSNQFLERSHRVRHAVVVQSADRIVVHLHQTAKRSRDSNYSENVTERAYHNVVAGSQLDQRGEDLQSAGEVVASDGDRTPATPDQTRHRVEHSQSARTC